VFSVILYVAYSFVAKNEVGSRGRSTHLKVAIWQRRVMHFVNKVRSISAQKSNGGERLKQLQRNAHR
jgi:hypothetical protein